MELRLVADPWRHRYLIFIKKMENQNVNLSLIGQFSMTQTKYLSDLLGCPEGRDKIDFLASEFKDHCFAFLRQGLVDQGYSAEQADAVLDSVITINFGEN